MIIKWNETNVINTDEISTLCYPWDYYLNEIVLRGRDKSKIRTDAQRVLLYKLLVNIINKVNKIVPINIHLANKKIQPKVNLKINNYLENAVVGLDIIVNPDDRYSFDIIMNIFSSLLCGTLTSINTNVLFTDEIPMLPKDKYVYAFTLGEDMVIVRDAEFSYLLANSSDANKLNKLNVLTALYLKRFGDEVLQKRIK